jgi:hypothetical protein
MKNKQTKKIHRKTKILGAFLISVLAISGGVLALPSMKKSDSQEITNYIKTDSSPSSDYIQKWNNEFSQNQEGFNSDLFLNNLYSQKAVNEGPILEALQNADYEKWTKALENLEGFPKDIKIMSKEDFEILVQLRTPKSYSDRTDEI